MHALEREIESLQKEQALAEEKAVKEIRASYAKKLKPLLKRRRALHKWQRQKILADLCLPALEKLLQDPASFQEFIGERRFSGQITLKNVCIPKFGLVKQVHSAVWIDSESAHILIYPYTSAKYHGPVVIRREAISWPFDHVEIRRVIKKWRDEFKAI